MFVCLLPICLESISIKLSIKVADLNTGYILSECFIGGLCYYSYNRDLGGRSREQHLVMQ